MNEIIKAFTADQCYTLLTKGVHTELIKNCTLDTPCKVYAYCTLADSSCDTFEKGKVIGEYVIYKHYTCNTSSATTTILKKLAGYSKECSFPQTFLFAGPLTLYKKPRSISEFISTQGDVISKPPLKFQYCKYIK